MHQQRALYLRTPPLQMSSQFSRDKKKRQVLLLPFRWDMILSFSQRFSSHYYFVCLFFRIFKSEIFQNHFEWFLNLARKSVVFQIFKISDVFLEKRTDFCCGFYSRSNGCLNLLPESFSSFILSSPKMLSMILQAHLYWQRDQALLIPKRTRGFKKVE